MKKWGPYEQGKQVCCLILKAFERLITGQENIGGQSLRVDFNPPINRLLPYPADVALYLINLQGILNHLMCRYTPFRLQPDRYYLR